MAANAQKMRFELDKIKNNAFDIKGHFALLFADLLAEKSMGHNAVFVANELIDEETLKEQLQKDYQGKEYVLLFYAHKPNSTSMKSPFFPEEPGAHTSVLLCKVAENNKIGQILNIDGFNYTSFVDILGERPGATAHPDIKQRLVLHAFSSSETSASKTPLQRASWGNMNCVIYAFSFVARILEIFNEQPNLITTLFPKSNVEKISIESLATLEEGILQGMVGKYITKKGSKYICDSGLTEAYNNKIRECLAVSYTQKNTGKETLITLESGNPVTSSSKQENKSHAINYNFALQAGIALSGGLSLAAFIVTGLALAAIITISTAGIGSAMAVGVVSGLLCCGLFHKKNTFNADQVAPLLILDAAS